MNNLEIASTVDPFKLPRVAFRDRQNLPTVSGIYFVLQGLDVLYVGRSSNIKSRWLNHHRATQVKKNSGSFIAWLESSQIEQTLRNSDVDLIDLESKFIARFNPSLNNSRMPIDSNKNNRFYVAGLGEAYKDILKVEAFLHGKTEGAVASELIFSGLESRSAQRKEMLIYLAGKKGLTVEQLWVNILNNKDL